MNESRREIRWGKTDNNIIIIVIFFCKKSAERLIVENRAPDKRDIEDNSKVFFSYFSMKTYVVILIRTVSARWF